MEQRHHVVIVGGGFGGLYAAQSLKRAPVKITLIDKRNFHLFQPLLYQVATGGLSPADISSPLRVVLKKQKNAHVVLGEVTDIDPKQKKVMLSDDEIKYDTLIIATGSSHHYFGNEKWENLAPGLKSIEDAIEIRRKIFLAFEAAERETDPKKREAYLHFVIVGGGPTGVEMAGAIAELSKHTLLDNFRSIDPSKAKITLLEGLDRILPTYSPELSEKAKKSLEKLGVTVLTNAMVTNIYANEVNYGSDDQKQQIATKTVFWGAGIKASPIGNILSKRTGVQLDKIGRVFVEPDLSLKNNPDIFVIGDLAHFNHQNNQPLPGVASVAMQQGRYLAGLIGKKLKNKSKPSFKYFDKGNLAVIGRHAAVMQLGKIKTSGYFAWLIWTFVHIMYLVEFGNRLMVFVQWAWNYITKNRSAQLITGTSPFPLKKFEKKGKPDFDFLKDIYSEDYINKMN